MGHTRGWINGRVQTLDWDDGHVAYVSSFSNSHSITPAVGILAQYCRGRREGLEGHRHKKYSLSTLEFLL